MKKENVFRKIMNHSLVGFPIGISVLMISYACVYLIAGENVFKNEIAQLQDISTLILQLIIVGCAYYLFFVLTNVVAHLAETRITSDKFAAEHPWKTVLSIFIITIATVLVLTLLNFDVFSENMKMMNIITFMIVFVSAIIVLCIKATIESDLVKKINQKLKERNK